MILQSQNAKLRRIKIRIDGPDKKGKNTCRQISVLDTDVESVYAFLVSKLAEETKKA
jgi:hypothetical protein